MILNLRPDELYPGFTLSQASHLVGASKKPKLNNIRLKCKPGRYSVSPSRQPPEL